MQFCGMNPKKPDWESGYEMKLGTYLGALSKSHIFGEKEPAVTGESTAQCFLIYIPYFIREDKIIVAAIAHDRRKPGYWKSRVESK